MVPIPIQMMKGVKADRTRKMSLHQGSSENDQEEIEETIVNWGTW